jgi:hypothetical protein
MQTSSPGLGFVGAVAAYWPACEGVCNSAVAGMHVPTVIESDQIPKFLFQRTFAAVGVSRNVHSFRVVCRQAVSFRDR